MSSNNNIYLPVLSTRLTCPISGKYEIGGSLVFGGIGLVSVRELRIRLNGTTTIAIDNRQSVASTVTPLNVYKPWMMNAGDYVELIASHTSLLSIDLAISEFQPDFWITKVG